MVDDVVSSRKTKMVEEIQFSIDGWGELILLSEREGATRHFPPYASSKFDGTSDGLPEGADAKLTV
jgi:hypothetical protein